METYKFSRGENNFSIILRETNLSVTINGTDYGRVLARKPVKGVGDAIVLNDKVVIAVAEQKELVDEAFATRDEALEKAASEYQMSESDRELDEYYHTRDLINHEMMRGETK